MRVTNKALASSTLACGVLALIAAPCAAQSNEGVYSVSGTEVGKGTYTGEIELRWTGSNYTFVRVVEFATYTYTHTPPPLTGTTLHPISTTHPVSTVWTGRAVDAGGGGVDVSVSLDRMGWAKTGPGLPTRTPVDGVPMAVSGTFSATLSGGYRGQGLPFADANETWTYLRAPGTTPIWSNERRVEPTHSPPPAWLKRSLFLLFGTHHQTPWVQPYVQRSDFQTAVHSFTFDRTDFALHRSRPSLLRVVNRLVDPLNLEEAVVKANAFGKTLRQKANGADLEIPQRFMDPNGAIASRDGNGDLVGDNDGSLWTGVYGYTQNLRHQVTGEAAALDNVERTVRSHLLQMQITGQPTEFARTVRTATGLPLTSGWVAGQGAFAGDEWKRGGNNDMFKGLLWGGLSAYESLQATSPLRTEYGQALGALVANHSLMSGSRGRNNQILANGVASLLLGPGPNRTAYKRKARNPLVLGYMLALGGGFHIQGISGWSGAHLGLNTMIMMTRLADHHNERLVGIVMRLALRRSAARQASIRRGLHALAAGGLGRLNLPSFLSRFSLLRPFDATEGVWTLRELPFPRALLDGKASLRRDWGASPYPELPWKGDWTTSRGRARGLVGPVYFETQPGNYVWKSNPFEAIGGRSRGAREFHSVDYLFAYWLARAHGVIGPND